MTLRNLDCHRFMFCLMHESASPLADSGEPSRVQYPPLFLDMVVRLYSHYGMPLESAGRALRPLPSSIGGYSLYLRAANAPALPALSSGVRLDWHARTLTNAVYLHLHAEHPRASKAIAGQLHAAVALETPPDADRNPHWLGEGYCWTAQCRNWLGETPARALRALAEIAGYSLDSAVATGKLGCGGHFALFLQESAKQQLLLPVAFVVYPQEQTDEIHAHASPNYLVFELIPRIFLCLHKLHRSSERFYAELLPQARAATRLPAVGAVKRGSRSLLGAAEQRALDTAHALRAVKNTLVQLQQLRGVMELNLQSLERIVEQPMFRPPLQQRLRMEPSGRYRNACHDARYWESELERRLEALRQEERTYLIQGQVVNIRLQRLLNYLFAVVAGAGAGELAPDAWKIPVGVAAALVILLVTAYFVRRAQQPLKTPSAENDAAPFPRAAPTNSKEEMNDESPQ